MKTPFKVGDRVAGYDRYARYVGTILGISATGILKVDAISDYILLHPNQCRRLVKKPRRRVWVKLPTDFHPQHRSNGMVSVDPVDGWVEFVEVPCGARKKKLGGKK